MTTIPVRERTASIMVSELFGPTFQGEGPSTGRRCGFIRLGHCNLDCNFCDTPYTWDWSRFDRKQQITRVPIGDLLDAVADMGVDRVVVTGGEPMVQHSALRTLLLALGTTGYACEVETNGTIEPDEVLLSLAHWNVSPKLSHSGVDQARALKPDVLRRYNFAQSAAFKFVCQSPADLLEVEAVCAASGIPAARVWIMPEGRDTDTIREHLRAVTEQAIRFGFNITSRLHVEVWGDERGH